jgi:hypothetical protein
MDAESLVEPRVERGFGDVGGMADLKERLRETVLDPLANPETNRAAEERFTRCGPGDFLDFMGFSGSPTHVFSRDRHATEVNDEIRCFDCDPRFVRIADLINGVIRNMVLDNASIDECPRRVSRVRRYIRRNSEMRWFIDIPVN